MSTDEQNLAETRITDDREDVKAEEFLWGNCIVRFADPKIYGFGMLFFLLRDSQRIKPSSFRLLHIFTP
jgi:MFS transporter, ACS family, DAL5 transporter family protein